MRMGLLIMTLPKTKKLFNDRAVDRAAIVRPQTPEQAGYAHRVVVGVKFRGCRCGNVVLRGQGR